MFNLLNIKPPGKLTILLWLYEAQPYSHRNSHCKDHHRHQDYAAELLWTPRVILNSMHSCPRSFEIPTTPCSLEGEPGRMDD